MPILDPLTGAEFAETIEDASTDVDTSPSQTSLIMGHNPRLWEIRRDYLTSMIEEGSLGMGIRDLVYVVIPQSNGADWCLSTHRERLRDNHGRSLAELEALAELLSL